MRNFLLKLTFLLIVSSANVFAQTITGTVVDEYKEPLPGVAVVVKGTTNGTFSNGQGLYSIKANKDDIQIGRAHV